MSSVPDLKKLTPDELSAYRIQLSRLKDLTLSDTEHEQCRRKIDEILNRGPSVRIARLEKVIDCLTTRIERAELAFAEFLTAAGVAGAGEPPHISQPAREAAAAMAANTAGPSQTGPKSSPLFIPVPTAPQQAAPTVTNPAQPADAPPTGKTKRGRGRPKGSKNKKTQEAQAAAGVAQVTNSPEAQAAANPATPVNGGEPVAPTLAPPNPTPPPAGPMSTNEVPAGQTQPAAAQGTAAALAAAAGAPPSAPLFED